MAEHMHSQFERNVIIDNTVDAYTMHYTILLLSGSYETISPERRAVLLPPTAGGSFHMHVKIYCALVLSVFQDGDKDFITTKRSVPEKGGLVLCHTAGGLIERFLMPQSITIASSLLSSLSDGVFCFLPMSNIPLRQQFLAIRSSQSLLNADIMADRSLSTFPSQRQSPIPETSRKTSSCLPYQKSL